MKSFPVLPYNPEYHPGYEYRKIDLPIEGDKENGEGCWCLLDPKDLIRHDDIHCFEQSVAILCNDSIKYPGLMSGQVIPFEFNGEFRPKADLAWLMSGIWRNK